MKRLLMVFILAPTLALAQANGRFAPPILPLYQPAMGTIYNGPGMAYQPGYVPSILPMWGPQPGWGPQQPFQRNTGGMTFGSMLPLLAMGLAMFSGGGSSSEGYDEDYYAEDDRYSDHNSRRRHRRPQHRAQPQPQSRSQPRSSPDSEHPDDEVIDTATAAEASVEGCRSGCGSGIRQPVVEPLPVAHVIPQVGAPVEPVVHTPRLGDTVSVANEVLIASVAPVSAREELVAETEPSEVASVEPVSIGVVPVQMAVAAPAPEVEPAAAPPRVAAPVRPQARPAGLGVPRRETPRTPVVVTARNAAERQAQDAPVWDPFMTAFAQCAPGCAPVQYAAYGTRGHASCHTSSRALDVFGMTCDGRVYLAINRGRFEEMVHCMQDKMKVLYRNHPDRNVTEGHRDHAHFSIGCTVGGRHVW